ncbi:MAG: toll/interleukin-1 receptor domain-containing protein [Clostridiales bacterium]|nr:toll/interleukin-1 receptor domain-containing protein [Clostridiales bacterium]
MEYQVFISYRREGGESLAALLHERLSRMGYHVFYDVESLRSGKFNTQLLSVIENCTDVLVVLPPNALDRCVSEEDWVRQEIAHALKCEKNVIPVMMRNFFFPDHLPKELEDLPNMEGISANMEYFDAVIRRIDRLLISKPEEQLGEEERKLKDLKKRAEQGPEPEKACNELGAMYEQGGVTFVSNLREAYFYYQRAYAAGSLAAEYNLSEIYEACAADFTLLREYGIEIDVNLPPDRIREDLLSRSQIYLESSAKKNYAPALYKLGNRYEETLELEQAFACYEQAGRQKYLPAMNALAWMYRNGIGVEADPERAQRLYEEAANAGFAPAVFNYANMIELQKPEEAMRLYKTVAYGDEAMPIAAYALGRRYEYDRRDLRSAISCYERAVNGGIEAAVDDLERCRNQLF